MKVKELIAKLLECPWDSDVYLLIPKDPRHDTGIGFHIDSVEYSGSTYLNFQDWREIVRSDHADHNN